MAGFFPTSSFIPPAVAPTTARYAPWVLLDTKAYLAVCENDTTAEAPTSTGHDVKVSFCVADPPAISHFCVYGPKFVHFSMEPTVLFSAKDLVLLRFTFTTGPRSTYKDSRLAEYFVYKAGRGKPSLKQIPVTPPGSMNSSHMCVLPFDDDEGEFVLADLCCITDLRSDYELHVFSSKTDNWTTTQLRLETPPAVKKEDLPGPLMDKAIALGGGAVGWIDLWRGIISCNVFDKNPVLSFIPVPILDINPRREGNPRPVRDITCCNGFIKFVELDVRVKKIDVHYSKTRKTTKDLDMVDVIHDSELLFHNDDACVKPVEHTLVDDGWKLRTCYRHTSWDYWRKGHTVDIDDIVPDYNPQLWDAEAGKSTLRNMYSAFPTLGIDGDNTVYMMSKAIYSDKNAWTIAVDLEKKTLEAIVPISSDRASLFKPDFLPCAFSEYLNATPRSCADKIISAPHGANDCVLRGHLSSCYIPRNNVPPLPNLWSNYGSSQLDESWSSNGDFQLACPGDLSCQWQTPFPISTSPGSGYDYQVDVQLMPEVLSTGDHGQSFQSLLFQANQQFTQLMRPWPASPPPASFTPMPSPIMVGGGSRDHPGAWSTPFQR